MIPMANEDPKHRRLRQRMMEQYTASYPPSVFSRDVAPAHEEVEGWPQAELASDADVELEADTVSSLAEQVAEMTVPEVQEYVERNPNQLSEVRAAEAVGRERSTLLAWLDAQGNESEP